MKEDHVELDRDQLLQGIATTTSDRRGRRLYSRELRESVVTYARKRMMSGGRQSGIARELGIDECTLSWWLRRNSKKTKRTMKPVVVMEKEASRTAVVLVLPSGIRIENLRLAEVVTLVRALG
jgi:transposase-like protein